MDDRSLTRFQAKIRRDLRTGCWIWTAAQNRRYGFFRCEGRARYAHRVSYEHYVGPVPDGLHIDHLCRNRLCVNPAHLEPVPQRVNNERQRAAKTECVRGHPFDEENTWINPRDRSRNCRACWRQRSREYKARRAA